MRRTTLIAVVAALAPSTGGCAVDAGTAVESAPSEARGADLEIAMTEMAFTPARIHVPAGEPVTLHVVNDGNMGHDLVLDDGTDSGMVAPGDSLTIEVGPFAGARRGICTVPGHEQAGMVLEIETE